MTTLADNAVLLQPEPPLREPFPDPDPAAARRRWPVIAIAAVGIIALLLVYSIAATGWAVSHNLDAAAAERQLEQVRLNGIEMCVELHRREFGIEVWPVDEMYYQIQRCAERLDADRSATNLLPDNPADWAQPGISAEEYNRQQRSPFAR